MAAHLTAVSDPVAFKLLSLNSDLLRVIAGYLPPPDRIALSHACKALYNQTWANFGLADLLARFPFERRVRFPLLPALRPGVRAVPDRAAQAHLLAAVSNDGRHAAVIPYDNLLRVVDTKSCTVVAVRKLSRPALRMAEWDLTAGVRIAPAQPDPVRAYADDAALDAECTLSYTSKDGNLLLTSPTHVALFDRLLNQTLEIDAAPLIAKLRALVANLDGCPGPGVAGAAALSPSETKLAWIMYAGWPARAYLTIWTMSPTPVCAYYVSLGVVAPARNSALAWARPVWRGEDTIVVALNSTQRMLHTERVGDAFRRSKLCRFRFFGVQVPDVKDVSFQPLQHVAEHSSWLSLSPLKYPAALATQLHHVAKATMHARVADDAVPDVSVNAVHTCPAEATYKGLSFGGRARHPWYVATQPVYSLHVRGARGRVLVAAAAHGNEVASLTRRDETYHRDATTQLRQFAFHGLPWRASFAAVCGFAANGRWLVGAALNNDCGFVCVRNVTDVEYGEPN